MTHGHFESTFSKYAFGRGGGGHKKEYAVYARENDDNYGRPLRKVLEKGFVNRLLCELESSTEKTEVGQIWALAEKK